MAKPTGPHPKGHFLQAGVRPWDLFQTNLTGCNQPRCEHELIVHSNHNFCSAYPPVTLVHRTTDASIRRCTGAHRSRLGRVYGSVTRRSAGSLNKASEHDHQRRDRQDQVDHEDNPDLANLPGERSDRTADLVAHLSQLPARPGQLLAAFL